MRLLRKLRRDESAQDLAEYAIALAVITIGTILVAAAVGADVTTLWSAAEPKLQTVIDAL
jgi:Flp pilus assembly pilin Flp